MSDEESKEDEARGDDERPEWQRREARDASGDATSSGGGRDDGGDGVTDVDVWRYLRLGAVGILSLLAVVATFRLYTSVSTVISRWVSPDFVPVFQAAFNLVVLLLALAGLAVLYRWRT